MDQAVLPATRGDRKWILLNGLTLSQTANSRLTEPRHVNGPNFSGIRAPLTGVVWRKSRLFLCGLTRRVEVPRCRARRAEPEPRGGVPRERSLDEAASPLIAPGRRRGRAMLRSSEPVNRRRDERRQCFFFRYHQCFTPCSEILSPSSRPLPTPFSHTLTPAYAADPTPSLQIFRK